MSSYATGASIYEAAGYAVAVACTAGNLAHVAKALRAKYPAALLVLCGDDDLGTFARTGNNPGRDKATAAARAVQGLAIFPAPLPADGGDFNDLHQYHGGAAGLEAVRCIVEDAIESHHASQAAAHAAQSSQAGKGSTARQNARHEASGADGDTARAFDVFAVNDNGVWHQGIDQDGKQKSPEWVCSRLDVEALTRDQDGGGWGYYVAFADPLGKVKQWAMPARMLAGDGGEYRATLLNMGLRIATTPRARNLLTQYIQTRQPGEFASCTDRIGWHGRAFVLPRETIGDDAERIVFQSDNAVENTFKSKGTSAFSSGENDRAICGLFGDVLLKSIDATLNQIEWPKDGLSAADRARRLGELDKKLEALRAEEQAFVSAATDTGINVAAVE